MTELVPIEVIEKKILFINGVILLHGLSRSNSSMKKMESALTEAGFVVENVDYPSRTASIVLWSGFCHAKNPVCLQRITA